MKLSLTSRAIILLFETGYSVSRKGVVRSPQGIPLSSKADKRGYRRLSVRLRGEAADKLGISRRRTLPLRVGRLQAYQKFGLKALQKGVFVRHGTKGSGDDSFGNIRIGSASDNMMDIPKEDRVRKARQAAATCRRFCPRQIRAMRAMRAGGSSLREIGEAFGIGKGHASDIVSQKLYADI